MADTVSKYSQDYVKGLENATRFSARLVNESGDEYWPIFERLERDLRETKERIMKLNKFRE